MVGWPEGTTGTLSHIPHLCIHPRSGSHPDEGDGHLDGGGDRSIGWLMVSKIALMFIIHHL